jgi:hypothetical protein
MLSIVELDPEPLADLRYLNAARRGGHTHWDEAIAQHAAGQI